LPAKPNFDVDCQSVADILECRPVDETKAAVSNFIAATDEVRSEHNGMLVWDFCRRLTDALTAFAESCATVPHGSARNATIIPPERAPILMLAMSVPLGGTPMQTIGGLKKFIARCDEFSAPIEDAIAPSEIEAVLECAERNFKIVSLIAPQTPLHILRMNNSHILHNSECGVPTNPEHAAVILALHPREASVYDRVFIFAHELGHALHLSLTHDVNTLPDKFDDFNGALGIAPESADHKPEMFADAVAYALLGDDCLREHLPIEFRK
jgi:hypothetical protein